MHWWSRASLEHFPECHFLKICANRVLGLPERYTKEQFLVLANDDTLVMRAAHLYFCKKTFDLSRHSDVTEFLPLYRSVVWHFKRCGGKLPEQFVVNLGTA